MPRRKKSSEETCPIRVVDSDERRRIMSTTDRGAFLNRLETVVNEPAFSIKDIKKKESNLGKKEKQKEAPVSDDLSSFTPDTSDLLDDNQWCSMLGLFDELDPMDDITSAEKYSYRKNSKSEFEDKFAKEYSMVHSLLGDIQKHSKMVSKQLEAMGMGSGKKGASGVSKYLVDLVNASASLHGTQLQAVKELVNIRKTIADLEFKEQKNNPKEEETVDTSASRFYDHIIGGGRKTFIEAANSNINSNNNKEDDDVQSVSGRVGFNISQPIPNQYDDDEEDDDDEYDKYNYINREKDNVSVCIQRFSDGDYSFVALDENGDEVLDYELPDHVALNSVKFSPTSNIATDKYGRKYRIVDIDTDMETY